MKICKCVSCRLQTCGHIQQSWEGASVRSLLKPKYTLSYSIYTAKHTAPSEVIGLISIFTTYNEISQSTFKYSPAALPLYNGYYCLEKGLKLNQAKPYEINVMFYVYGDDVAQCGHEVVGGHALASYCVSLMVTLTNMVIHQSVMSAQILPTTAAATIQTTYITEFTHDSLLFTLLKKSK